MGIYEEEHQQFYNSQSWVHHKREYQTVIRASFETASSTWKSFIKLKRCKPSSSTSTPGQFGNLKLSAATPSTYASRTGTQTKERRIRLHGASTGPLHEPFANSQHRPGVFVYTHVKKYHASLAIVGKDCSSSLF